MHQIEIPRAGSRTARLAAASVIGVAWLLLSPIAIAQTQPPNQPQTSPRQQASPGNQSPAPGVSDQQLDAAAKAIRQVTAVRQTYARKIAQAPSSDKARIAGEANGALVKAVTDQGLSVDEYNAILTRAQTDATLRQRLVERIRPATQ